jgi:hypothetical protein
MTLSVSDTQHNNVLPCAECRFAECSILFTIMMNDIMLNVVLLSVVAPDCFTISFSGQFNTC